MEQSQVDPSQSQEICEEDESESAMASASDQREEELQVMITEYVYFFLYLSRYFQRCSGRTSWVC